MLGTGLKSNASLNVVCFDDCQGAIPEIASGFTHQAPKFFVRNFPQDSKEVRMMESSFQLQALHCIFPKTVMERLDLSVKRCPPR